MEPENLSRRDALASFHPELKLTILADSLDPSGIEGSNP
jgi:hypothetical protein